MLAAVGVAVLGAPAHAASLTPSCDAFAIDGSGTRLGRGKGYYDRLLAAVRGTKCGVAFDEQIVGAIPVGPLDIRVNCIVTPTRWVEVAGEPVNDALDVRERFGSFGLQLPRLTEDG